MKALGLGQDCFVTVQGGSMSDFQLNSKMEKFLSNDLDKIDIRVKKLQYKMDFGTTEILIKMGLN